MTDTRTLAINLVGEQAAEIATESTDSLWQRCYTLCSLAAYSLYEVSEAQLRGFLGIGGIDLDNPEEFDIASGMSSAFVLVRALFVTDLLPGSLIDLEHDMLKRIVLDEKMLADMEDTKFQGIMWRESLVDVV